MAAKPIGAGTGEKPSKDETRGRRPARVAQEKIWELGSVIADRLDRTTFHCLFALGLFFRRLGLLFHVGIAAVIVAGEILRGRFAAEVAVDALIIDVILAGHIFGVSVGDVSHSSKWFQTRPILRQPLQRSSPNCRGRQRGLDGPRYLIILA